MSTRKAPPAILKVMSFFDREVKGMLPLLGERAPLDNSATVGVLGWQPTPIEDSVIEMARGLAT